jgi:hypothetical protein
MSVIGTPLSDKKAATAGVLQLFFGMFGAGRFHIGSTTIGRCQLGVTIFAFALMLVGISTPEGALAPISNLFPATVLLWIGVAIWAFIDAILMFTRIVTDGQGRKLR